jgi:hypothetical protein
MTDTPRIVVSARDAWSKTYVTAPEGTPIPRTITFIVCPVGEEEIRERGWRSGVTPGVWYAAVVDEDLDDLPFSHLVARGREALMAGLTRQIAVWYGLDITAWVAAGAWDRFDGGLCTLTLS